MTADALRPVSRLRVVGGAVLLVMALGSVIGLSEGLRHPAPIEPAQTEPDPGDPRDAVECPDAPPEGGGPVLVNSDQLYDCPQLFDGAAVRYEGEVVGALMRRPSGVWTQINDDVYAGDLGPLPAHREFRGGNAGVGVHVPYHVAEEVREIGGPRTRGDILLVTGTFHRSDPRSGEVGVIRADDGRVIRRGTAIEADALPDRRAVGAILALLATAVTIRGRVRRRT